MSSAGSEDLPQERSNVSVSGTSLGVYLTFPLAGECWFCLSNPSVAYVSSLLQNPFEAQRTIPPPENTS